MLSIIIPFYKLAYFEDTIQSLANQTNKDFKVYIGDDASPDDCSVLLGNYKGKFDFTYHRFEDNLGSTSLTKHWDRCIALSNDQWIMILGDDDFLDTTVVESFYGNLKTFSGNSNVVRFATRKVFDKAIDPDAIDRHPIWENATDAFYRKFSRITRSSLSEYIFTRTAYLKYGFYDYPLAWNSDDRAWLDFSDGKPIFSINESCVYFRLSSLNISGRNDNQRVKNVSEIEFFKFLVFKKLNFFSREQKLRLLRRYQAEIRVYKSMSISDFFTLLYFYIKYINIDWVKKFFKKVIKKIFQK